MGNYTLGSKLTCVLSNHSLLSETGHMMPLTKPRVNMLLTPKLWAPACLLSSTSHDHRQSMEVSSTVSALHLSLSSFQPTPPYAFLFIKWRDLYLKSIILEFPNCVQYNSYTRKCLYGKKSYVIKLEKNHMLHPFQKFSVPGSFIKVQRYSKDNCLILFNPKLKLKFNHPRGSTPNRY